MLVIWTDYWKGGYFKGGFYNINFVFKGLELIVSRGQ